MPTVPRVEGPGVQVGGLPSARVDVRATPDSMGAAVGRGLESAAQLTGQIYQHEQETTNTAAILEARTHLSDWERGWFDPNNTDGVMAHKGRDALALPDKVRQDFDKTSGQISQQLGNPSQRQAFAAEAQRYRDQVLNRVDNYAYGENQRYQQEQFAGGLDNSREVAGAAAASGDLERAQQELRVGLGIIDQHAKLFGTAPEQVTKLKNDMISGVHESAVNGLVQQGNVIAARQYFLANRGQMSEKSVIDAAKTVMTGEILSDPQAAAHSLGGAVPLPTPSGSMAQMIVSEANAAGVDPHTALAIANLESGIKPDAVNAKSGAAGAFQLTDASWKQFGSGLDRNSPSDQAKAGIAYIANSQKELRAAFGRDPTPHEIYMAHLFGAAGAKQVLKADDKASIRDVVRGYDPKNADASVDNNGMGGLTVGVTKAKWSAMVDKSLSQTSGIPLTVPQDARRGELGVLKNPDGSVSTEISTTVTDPSLNDGKATNIPLLVKGQIDVEKLQAGGEPTAQQQEIAIRRAADRVKDGAKLPSFGSIDEAVAAAKARSDAKGSDASAFQMTAPVDPVVQSLPIGTRIQLHTMAVQQLQLRDNTDHAEIDQRMKDSIAAFSLGKQDPRPMGYDDFLKGYGPTRAAAEFAQYRSWQQFGADVAQVQTMPFGEQAAFLKAHEPQPGEGFDQASQRFQSLAGAVDRVNRARVGDPMQAAQQEGGIPVNTLDFSKAANLPDQMALRVASAKQTAQNFGTPLTMFTKAEQGQLSGFLAGASSADRAQFLGSMHAGMRDPQAYTAAIQQIAPNHPVIAVAGAIMSKQDPIVIPHWYGDEKPMMQGDVAQTMLEGEALLNPPKTDKNQDGKPSALPIPPDKQFRDAFVAQVGDVFRNDPQSMELAMQSAKAYYVGASSRSGNWDPAIVDGKLWDQSIKAATGGVVDYNGRGKVLLPWGMPEDRFNDIIESAWGDRTQAYGPLTNYGLETHGDGSYLVRSGSGYLLDSAGRPVMLNASDAQPAVSSNVRPTATRTNYAALNRRAK